MEEKIEISKEILRGVYMILCGVSSDHSSAEVYEPAKPIMRSAHISILALGNELGFDCRGGDL